MLNKDLLPFLNSIKELFHTEMDQQTSACLYGSATTEDWVARRSDLDLFALVPEEQIELFGEKIKIWKSKLGNPILDGFVLSSSGNVSMVREFHKFEKTIWHRVSFIPLIDLWKVKNQSIYLFGQDMKTFVRDIDREELKDWAIKDIENHWIPHLNALVSGSDASSGRKIPLSTLISMASGVAQMLMLARGIICNSKRELLKWLADEHIEIREKINLFREDFEKSDDLAITLSVREATALGRFYLGLLREVKR
jgi:hypothetical protein